LRTNFARFYKNMAGTTIRNSFLVSFMVRLGCVAPAGLSHIAHLSFPPIPRWATIFRPSGTRRTESGIARIAGTSIALIFWSTRGQFVGRQCAHRKFQHGAELPDCSLSLHKLRGPNADRTSGPILRPPTFFLKAPISFFAVPSFFSPPLRSAFLIQGVAGQSGSEWKTARMAQKESRKK
jgi:hypothetical protein